MGRRHCYSLVLADGNAWNITAVNGAEAWLDRFASIMRLGPCGEDNLPRLVVARKASLPDGRLDPLINGALDRPLPGDGWAVQDIRFMRVMRHPGVRDVVCEIEKGDREMEFYKMGLSLLPVYQRSQESGGLPLHAALAEKNGFGILLCAPGGTGKSTCSRRLPAHWRPLCDDEALVVKAGDGRYMAHPFPTWSDYIWRRAERTWRVERPVPLSALFFLEQSEVEDAVRLGQARAAVMINHSASQVCRRGWAGLAPEAERAHKVRLFDNACMLARAAPSFILRFGLEGRFWEVVERALCFHKGDVP